MRSFDRAMPEELNRVLTDHLSDVLLCPSPTAVANLEREHVAGRDRARRRRDGRRGAALPAARAGRRRPAARGGRQRGRVRAGHRAPRGQRRRPARACGALVDLLLALPLPVVLPLHPRTRARLEAAGWLGELEDAAHVRLLPPLGYVAFTALLVARPRGAHRLGRRAEGGLPGRRAVRDDARHDRVGRDRRGRLERAGRPRRRRGAGRAGAHAARPSAPSSTATGTRARASSPRSPALSAQPPPMRRSATPAAAKRAPSSSPRPSTIARTPGRSSGPRAV